MNKKGSRNYQQRADALEIQQSYVNHRSPEPLSVTSAVQHDDCSVGLFCVVPPSSSIVRMILIFFELFYF